MTQDLLAKANDLDSRIARMTYERIQVERIKDEYAIMIVARNPRGDKSCIIELAKDDELRDILADRLMKRLDAEIDKLKQQFINL